MTIDLTIMPIADRHELVYAKYISIFKQVAESKDLITVINPPVCWIPLLNYLGAYCNGRCLYFDCDYWINLTPNEVVTRSTVEFFCSLRPELMEALCTSDVEWKTVLPEPSKKLLYEKEFVVTTMASFFRREIREYLHILHTFIPEKRKAILVPCSADKPYPSLIHEAVLGMMPDDYHLIVTTGALGLVPQELWEYAPYYDAKVPNQWRLQNEVERYFTKWHYQKVIVYTDVYCKAIEVGALLANQEIVKLFNNTRYYSPYANLLSKDNLIKLKNVLESD